MLHRTISKSFQHENFDIISNSYTHKNMFDEKIKLAYQSIDFVIKHVLSLAKFMLT